MHLLLTWNNNVPRISERLYATIDVQYKIFSTADEILASLDNGDVDCLLYQYRCCLILAVTSGFLIVGKAYNTEQRKNYFLPSCYLNTVFAQWVVTISSGIKTEEEIMLQLDNNQALSVIYCIRFCH